MMKITESGWYRTTEEDGLSGYRFLGGDPDELVDALESEDLNDILMEWAEDNYSFDDFLTPIIYRECACMDRDDIISDWKEDLDTDTIIYSNDGDICYMERGEEIDIDADFIIDSNGDRIDAEDEEDEEEED